MQSKQLRSLALAFGLMFFGTFSLAWGAVPSVGHGGNSQELSTNQAVAMGVGAIGGVLAYCIITGDLGLGIWSGVEAASLAAPAAATATGVAAPAAAVATPIAAAAPAAQVLAAAPNAAAQFVAAWGGRQVFIPASAAVGALVGDWIHSN